MVGEADVFFDDEGFWCAALEDEVEEGNLEGVRELFFLPLFGDFFDFVVGY